MYKLYRIDVNKKIRSVILNGFVGKDLQIYTEAIVGFYFFSYFLKRALSYGMNMDNDFASHIPPSAA